MGVPTPFGARPEFIQLQQQRMQQMSAAAAQQAAQVQQQQVRLKITYETIEFNYEITTLAK